MELKSKIEVSTRHSSTGIEEELRTSGLSLISYVEWHRNRDRMAQEQRNIEVHKKSLAGNSN